MASIFDDLPLDFMDDDCDIEGFYIYTTPAEMRGEALRPCPLCGRAVEYEDFFDGFFWYERASCVCGLRLDVPRPTKDSNKLLHEKWNRRVE